VIALGARALRSNDLRSASRAELETLAQQTGESVTLEVLAGDRVLILDEVTGQHLLGSTQFIGTLWPAHATSTGKALLAEISDAERRSIVHAPLAKLTSRTITTLAALRDELARVQRRGYATAIEELEAGYVAVGAAVRNY
jgi:DNA-binding IclR family transcriptional regulator